ncbi:MAG: ABC transporter permease subunit [Gammaproteobacteria bacterium]|nr:MAG: ABC transporter permease subunit [Gammaproteobacteria bacterium]
MKQDNSSPDLNLAKTFSIRNVRDLITQIIVYAGGGSVFIALGLIFVYLGIEVVPLFQDIDLSDNTAKFDSSTELVHLSLEEQNEVALTLHKSGTLRFIEIDTGKIISEQPISEQKPVSEQQVIAAHTLKESSNVYVLAAFADGTALLVKPEYKSIYSTNTKRTILPSITYPLGKDPLKLHDLDKKIANIAFQVNEEQVTIVSTSSNELFLTKLLKQESFYDDSISWEKSQVSKTIEIAPDYVFADQSLQNIVVLDETGRYLNFDKELSLRKDGDFLQDDKLIVTTAQALSAGSSLLIADSSKKITQWFPVRNKSNVFEYTKIRDFEFDGTINTIVPEYSRKVAYAYGDNGIVSVLHATSGQVLIAKKLAQANIDILAISPRSNAVLVKSESSISLFDVHNEHPEFSMSSIWSKVWYEGYEKPEFIWQSSSSSNDFEPKFSFMPLAFGTLKAAFYAMLFATPIGVLAGAYTAYFMSPRLRKVVKPTVEIMAALPTVILGFLAGLWLAPFIESNLPGIFTAPIVVLVGVIVLSFVWTIIPKTIRNYIPEGYEILLLIPVIIILIWLPFYFSPLLEIALFDGNTRQWLTDDMGIDFDQRNSIIIGITMGIAVIPNIFSITEDAVFGVPKSLTNGSLALGATHWQTMTRVIILTASPAIFSAIMIGMGRAIGETMIVLMATGNTPIMDFNIFEGMRTLAANIAVEMPEAEVGSTHFRLLFLSAFTLFILTFIFNTMSEIISTRLRNKYSNL